MGAVLVRDVIVEVIIRRLFRREISAMEVVRASLRGVYDRRCECRFAGMTDRNTVRRRCDNRGEIGAMACQKCGKNSALAVTWERKRDDDWSVMAAISATLMNIKTGTRAWNLDVAGDDFRRESCSGGGIFALVGVRNRGSQAK